MGYFDKDEEVDSYWECRRRQAYEAMNDRESGLLGQVRAESDYKDLCFKAGKTEKDIPV